VIDGDTSLPINDFGRSTSCCLVGAPTLVVSIPAMADYPKHVNLTPHTLGESTIVTMYRLFTSG